MADPLNFPLDSELRWYGAPTPATAVHAMIGLVHPGEMGAAEIECFLTHLAVNRDLAASSQNQALNALIFLYRTVLDMPVESIDAMRAKRSQHLPVVLTQGEVATLLGAVKGDAGLAIKSLYGCGLRVAEVLRLRISRVGSWRCGRVKGTSAGC